MNINIFNESNCSPCNQIWKPVEELPSVEKATRNHAYILPDNTVWVLNHDGNEFVKADGTESDPLNIINTDGKLTIAKDNNSFTINLAEELPRNGVELPSLQPNQFIGTMGNGLEAITEATKDIIEAGTSEVATIVSPKELREAIVDLINKTVSEKTSYDDTALQKRIENLEKIESIDSEGNSTLSDEEQYEKEAFEESKDILRYAKAWFNRVRDVRKVFHFGRDVYGHIDAYGHSDNPEDMSYTLIIYKTINYVEDTNLVLNLTVGMQDVSRENWIDNLVPYKEGFADIVITKQVGAEFSLSTKPDTYQSDGDFIFIKLKNITSNEVAVSFKLS